jgi:hypothetical protein
MAIIRTYHCSGCRNNLGPRIGLIVKSFVECSRCRARVYVSRDMVIDNWSRNIYRQCALAVWLGLTVHYMTAPPKSVQGHSATGSIVVMLLVGWLPALICALPVIPVGYVLGHVAACFLAKGPPQPEVAWPSRYGAGRVPEDHQWR